MLMVLMSLTFHTRWVTPNSSVTSISGAAEPENRIFSAVSAGSE
jgi:hypothetical protein